MKNRDSKSDLVNRSFYELKMKVIKFREINFDELISINKEDYEILRDIIKKLIKRNEIRFVKLKKFNLENYKKSFLYKIFSYKNDEYNNVLVYTNFIERGNELDE